MLFEYSAVPLCVWVFCSACVSVWVFSRTLSACFSILQCVMCIYLSILQCVMCIRLSILQCCVSVWLSIRPCTMCACLSILQCIMCLFEYSAVLYLFRCTKLQRCHLTTASSPSLKWCQQNCCTPLCFMNNNGLYCHFQSSGNVKGKLDVHFAANCNHTPHTSQSRQLFPLLLY